MPTDVQLQSEMGLSPIMKSNSSYALHGPFGSQNKLQRNIFSATLFIMNKTLDADFLFQYSQFQYLC